MAEIFFFWVWLLGVSVNEVEALYELYKKISCSIINDGLIHKVFANCSLFIQFPRNSCLPSIVFYLSSLTL